MRRRLTSGVEGTVTGVGTAEVRVATGLRRGREGGDSRGGSDEGSGESE